MTLTDGALLVFQDEYARLTDGVQSGFVSGQALNRELLAIVKKVRGPAAVAEG